MRLLAFALLVPLLAGCASSDGGQPAAARDVDLQGTVRNDGSLPLSYRVEVRQFQADERLEDQDGPVLWSAQGDVPPGEADAVRHPLDGEGDYWVVTRFRPSPSAFDQSTGFSFRLEPPKCDPTVTFEAHGDAGLTGFGSGVEVDGCHA